MPLLGHWLLVVTLVGAAVLVVHAALVVSVFRAEKATGLERFLAVIPPLSPVLGWRVGLRWLPVAWTVLVLTYLVLRAVRWG